MIDLQDLEEKMSKVTNYCSDEKNFKVPVMKAVEQVLGKSNEEREALRSARSMSIYGLA